MSPKSRLLPLGLIFAGLLMGSGLLLMPMSKTPHSPTKQAPSPQLPEPRAAMQYPEPPAPTASPTETVPRWTDNLPVLPSRLGPASLISCEEVLWDNGVLQRRSIHQQSTDGAHTLLLESAISSGKLVTRYLYAADHLLLIEKGEPLNGLLGELRVQGFQVAHPSLDSAHAYVQLPHPAEIFSNMLHLKQLIGSRGTIQLDSRSP